MKTLLFLFFTSFFLVACSSNQDPQIAKRIAELESKKNLDEFDKMELKDLKEQRSSGPSLEGEACKR